MSKGNHGSLKKEGSIRKRVSKIKETSNRKKWFITIVGGLFFLYAFIVMNILNSVGGQIIEHFSLDVATLGFLSSSYFWGNFLALIFAGSVIDVISIRSAFLFPMIGLILSLVLLGVAENTSLLIVSRLLGGVASSFSFLSCVKLGSLWFSTERLEAVTGWLVFMAFLGGIFAQTPVVYIASIFNSWRSAVLVAAALGVVILLVMLVVVRAPRSLNQKKALLERDDSLLKRIKFSLKEYSIVSRRKNNWFCSLYTTLLNVPIFVLGALWGNLYLQKAHNFTRHQSSFICSMIFFGTMIGSPVVGLILARWRRHARKIMFWGAILSLLTILIPFLSSSISFQFALIIFFLLGFFSAIQIASYPIITATNEKKYTARAISVVSILLMASGFVSQPLFGWLLSIGGKTVYTILDYNRAYSIMPISFLLAAFLPFLIRDHN